MTVLAQFSPHMELLARNRMIFEDFDHAVVDGTDSTNAIGDPRWVITADAGETQAIVAAGTDGTIFSLACDGDDNDEAYLATNVELFKFAAEKPTTFETRVKYTEASTDDANIFAGLMDAVGADSLVDNGGGPKATSSHMLFFKVDGDTVWSVENSIGSTAKTTKLDADGSLTGEAITAGGSFQKLSIVHRPTGGTGGTTADIMFYVDDVLVAKHKDQTVASATPMSIGYGVKAGGANTETLLIDYSLGSQVR